MEDGSAVERIMKTIKVVEYSNVPGPRYRWEGLHSGEDFRETQLLPLFLEARSAGEPLVIELDGVKFGYPTSFLEESFGGLARIVGVEPALETLRFRTSQEPLLVKEIKGYIQDANKTSRERADAKRAASV